MASVVGGVSGKGRRIGVAKDKSKEALVLAGVLKENLGREERGNTGMKKA